MHLTLHTIFFSIHLNFTFLKKVNIINNISILIIFKPQEGLKLYFVIQSVYGS